MTPTGAGGHRVRRTLPSALILGLACWVAYVSFNVDDPEPYLFPRLVSLGLVLLALMAVVQAAGDGAVVGRGLTLGVVRAIVPALVVMGGYVFFAVESLGMYAASTAAFFLVVVLHDPSPHTELRSWLKRIAVTAGFMAVMYGLFAMLLKVQTPRGLFI